MSDAIERGLFVRKVYSENRWGDEDVESVAEDVIADQLCALPEWQWHRVIRMALIHAYEETVGEGSTNQIRVLVDGIERNMA